MGDQIIAAVFPGQGSQRAGMGKDFYDQVKESRDVFVEASDTLGWNVAEICFNEDDRLNLTEFTQPCILAAEIAMLRGLYALYGFAPALFGGHSLGEFTALVASGCLPLVEALKIVHERGHLMQKAVPVGVGGMAAITSEDLYIEGIQAAIAGLKLDICNVNSADQVVIGGVLDDLAIAQDRLTETMSGRPFKYSQLIVSAPFHSRFMAVIEEPFRETLAACNGNLQVEAARQVTSNYTGTFHEGSVEAVRNNLVAQLSHAVQWRKNMEQLSERATAIYEVGPGRPLRKFFVTIGVSCTSILTLNAARSAFETK